MSLMGLDIGTSGSKCTLFNEAGNAIAFAYQDYPIIHSHSGYAELNPNEVWQAVQKVIYQVTRDYQGAPIQALSISSFGESAVPVGVNGEVLGNSILYTDSRGQLEAKRLQVNLGGEQIMALTGIPVHPMYTINKIMWIKEHQPEIYLKTWKFMLFGDFIAYQLTGIAMIDYSLASRTMAMNITQKAWEPAIMEAAGIDSHLFSELVPSGHIIGTVSKKIAATIGLSPKTLVVAGGHDQACAALGAGVLQAGQAIDGIGTVECIVPTFKQPVLNKSMLQHNFNCAPHTLPNHYLTYAFNFTGGSLLKWYVECYGQIEAAEARRRGISVYDIFNELAGTDPTELLVIPHFAGSGTPFMNPAAKGMIYGLSFETTPAHIYRGLLEGITYEMLYNLECLELAGIKVDTLKAVGGGAKSELWMQMKADIMGRKVETLAISEAGTMGTAILAGIASGVYPSYETAVEQLVKVKRTYYPNPKITEIYQANYARYKKLSSLVREGL
ncbi:hypothetical protein EHS13_29675 [Paenibacillus psychroresistens]|uniref:Xylulokinase n=1 Tax=Paenibacillus psychroresistens TaxID=1778678 RepID=A0A6B8RSN2_9BACL|nr:FGGY-family carbohydrate kinase [Paenibacillus psychroresistens]QGQ98752.1 hypothetical protein EHS13_29675 [Paenibacillus psychroresistens]